MPSSRPTVAVVGAGISGALAARELSATGLSVTIFDGLKQGEANATDLSGGLVRAFDIDPCGREQAAAVVYGSATVRSREAAFVQVGALTAGVERGDAATFTSELAPRFGFEAQMLTSREVKAALGVNLPPGAVSVYEPGAGYMSPARLASKSIADAKRDGATLRRRSRVRAVDADLKGVTVFVEGDEARHRFDFVVLALGAWHSMPPDGLEEAASSEVMAIQVVYVERPHGVRHPTIFDYDTGVYAAPIGSNVSLIGLSTGRSYRRVDDPGVSRIDDVHVARTLQAAAGILPWTSAARIEKVVRGFDGVAKQGAANLVDVGESGRLKMIRPWNGAGAKHASAAASSIREQVIQTIAEWSTS